MLNFKHPTPIVILAPMAGYSDAPMREMVSDYGVDAVVSEMMACQEWASGKRGVAERIERGNLADDTYFIVQIAGRDPNLLAEAARFAQDQGADQIDINMGCPAKKVISGATAGAALLLEPGLALEIVEQVARSVSIPVSVKTRLGWDTPTTKALAQDLEPAGARMLTIHGRTRQQKYRGVADWEAVGDIQSKISIPLIVNGDIVDTASAEKALRASGAQGVMIGRAAIGKPALLSQIRSQLKDDGDKPMQKSMISKHYQKILEHYGCDFGLLSARKHLKAYFSHEQNFDLKGILRETDPVRVLDQIQAYEEGQYV